jgi:hypothetical protein
MVCGLFAFQEKAMAANSKNPPDDDPLTAFRQELRKIEVALKGYRCKEVQESLSTMSKVGFETLPKSLNDTAAERDYVRDVLILVMRETVPFTLKKPNVERLRPDRKLAARLWLLLAWLDEIEQQSLIKDFNVADCPYENELAYLKSRHGVNGKFEQAKVTESGLFAITRSHSQVERFINRGLKSSSKTLNPQAMERSARER